MPRLAGSIIIPALLAEVKPLPIHRKPSAPTAGGEPQRNASKARYNHPMRSRATLASTSFVRSLLLTTALSLSLLFAPACTFYGSHPARAMKDATGGEGLERVFWNDVKSANWVEVDRSLASNYLGITPGGSFDRAAALDQYHQWQLKDFAVGDLKTELNGSTFVVTYTITLNGVIANGAGGSQPLPSSPQHMMTVWQQQKEGWVVIAHSVSGQ